MSGPLSNPFMFKSAAGAADFYTHQIANSARFTSSGVLTRTAGTATNEDKFTISCWVKRSKLGATQHFIFGDQSNIHYQRLSFNSSDKLEMHEQRGAGDSNGVRTVDQVFRDTSAWMHIVWTYDSAQGTDTNREKFYVNGSQLTDVEGWDGDYPSQNRDSVFNKNGSTLKIGGASSYYGNYFQGYMAEVVFCDGQAYAASDFGETNNGVWRPKDPSGLTFGDNGFYLNFANASDMGNDVSGNNNDFTEANVDTHDQMTDTPTFNSSSNGGNFATIGPLWRTENITLAEGNLAWSGSANERGMMSNWAIPIGTKVYFEYYASAWAGSENDTQILGVNQGHAALIGGDRGGDETAYSYRSNGYKAILTSKSVYGSEVSWGTGNIISCAVDRVNHTINFARNNSWQGTFSISSTMDLYPFIGNGGGTGTAGGYINFGQDGTFAGTKTAGGNADGNGYGNFIYSPPSGFLAMCTGNLPVADAIDPAQTDDNFPQKLFSAKLYTGTGSTNALTGLGFQPDWVWIKERGGANNHMVFDSTRGTSKYISANTNGDQGTDSATMNTFGSDGFTVGGDGKVNASSDTYVAWNWRANGGSTSSGSGDLTSTHQVDPSGGFSIVFATGDGGSGDKTVTHGMSAAPDCILAKSLETSSNWDTYWSSGTTSGYGLRLNTNDAQLSGRWGTVNSSIFTVKYNYTWLDSNDYIYYCFRNIEGYIKVGSYIANSNADNIFVYTGFKPAFLLVKGVVSGAGWVLEDNKTSPFNPSAGVLEPNQNSATYTTANPNADFLSNGFKVRTNNAVMGSSSYDPYVYLAFAENPFKYATAR